MDVRDGSIKVRCKLPGLDEPYHELPMERDGVRYEDGLTNPNVVLWRTQWISQDFRWIISGEKEVFDLANGHHVTVIESGRVVAVSDSTVLARDGDDWCAAQLSERGVGDCLTLAVPAGDGAFVLNSSGKPAWVSAGAMFVRFPGGVASALTDGERVYRAEFFPPKERQVGSQVDPTGLALFSESEHDNEPSGYQPYDWFTIYRVGHGQIQARARRSTVSPDAYYDFTVNFKQSKAAIGGGRAAVFSHIVQTGGLGSELVTKFYMLVEGQSKIFDISADHNLVCHGNPCQILAWPDLSLDLAMNRSPSP